MQPTIFQPAEIRDSNDNIIRQGAYGKNSPLANATNDAWIDYVMNNLEFLYDLAKDEVVPVSALPASGDMNKTYLLTTTGVCYRWDGAAWVEISSSEAVGRAETAANLAEQWATKTSGTVADNEYSAKYYANSAQQSADDAQDVADDMADHLAQIDQNTGGVSANSKRIGNIEKLLQGNLYDYDTDDDTAYTKAVPAGAMPYAGLEKVGGKTLVWNQLIYDPNFTDATKWQQNPSGDLSTFSVSDNVGTMTMTSNYDSWLGLVSSINTPSIAGHKYLFIADLKGSPTNTTTFFAGATSGTFTYLTDSWQHVKGILTCTSNTAPRLMLYWGGSGKITGEYLSVRNFCVYDLTAMFGAGNEPTIQQFEALFPASYYSYSVPTLLSAGVTEVESDSINVWDEEWENGYYDLNGAKAGNSNTTYIRSKNFTPVQPSTAYYYKAPAIHASNNTYFCVFYYDANKTFISYAYAINEAKTTPANAHYINFYAETGVSNSVYQHDICINVSNASVNGTYHPHTIATYTIPAAVQALEGYGWSAGSVYNEIDFERKVFIKRVGKVVLDGTQTIPLTNWQPKTNSVGWAYLYSVASVKIGTSDGFVPNVVTNCLLPINYRNAISNDVVGVSIPTSQSAYSFVIRVSDTSLTTSSAINAYLSANPITVYYELAIPVETDISAYLMDDNLIQVESGGTLTFENQHGDDYQIPVPSEEEYMIDLQSAIGG